MSSFVVKSEIISELSPIEGADKIEVAKINGYSCVVQKGIHKEGSVIVYVPEAALMPEKLLKLLNLEGKLAGSKKNRVKAIKLRGVLSQGIVIPIKLIAENYGIEPIDIIESENLMSVLNIQKYIPEVPASFNGDGIATNDASRISFDIENYKNEPNLIGAGEEVYITEKLHGTMAACGVGPVETNTKDNVPYLDVMPFASSKGMLSKGIIFPFSEENLEKNVYTKVFRELNIDNKLGIYRYQMLKPTEGIVLFGEIFGNGIQDLKYDQEKPTFKGFAVYIYEGNFNNGSFLNAKQSREIIEEMWIQFVPILKIMKYNPEAIHWYAKGNTTLGDQSHVREGVVVSSTERPKMLKFINDDYLTRKNGTEYN